MRRGFIAGLALAVGGAAILVGQSFQVGPDHTLGDALAILTAMFYAAYILMVRHVRRHLPSGMLMLWGSVTTAVFLLPVTLLAGESLRVPKLHGWAIVVAPAVISYVGGQGLITYALGHVAASFSAVALLLEPVVATIAAWFLFAEALRGTQMLGGLVVPAGIYLCHRARSRVRDGSSDVSRGP